MQWRLAKRSQSAGTRGLTPWGHNRKNESVFDFEPKWLVDDDDDRDSKRQRRSSVDAFF